MTFVNNRTTDTRNSEFLAGLLTKLANRSHMAAPLRWKAYTTRAGLTGHHTTVTTVNDAHGPITVSAFVDPTFGRENCVALATFGTERKVLVAVESTAVMAPEILRRVAEQAPALL